MYINADFEKVVQGGSQMNLLKNEYLNNINELYTSLNKLSDCWQGEDSEKYLSVINPEKKIFCDFGDVLENFSSQIIKSTNELSSVMEDNKM